MVASVKRWVVAVMLEFVVIALGGCDEPPADLGNDYPDCLCADTSDAGAEDTARVCDIPPDAGPCNKP